MKPFTGEVLRTYLWGAVIGILVWACALFVALTGGLVQAQESGAIKYPENGTGPVARFTADDPEGDAITWSKSGADEALFAISDDGVLTFVSPPDYEAPGDTGTDHIYEVTVTATDDDDSPLTDSHTVMVEVTNVEEAATVGIQLSSLQPQVSTAITVDYVDSVGNPLVDMGGNAYTGIVDPDQDKADDSAGTSIPADDVEWQWSKSSSRSGPFTDITGDAAATTHTYTPGSSDRGMYLRVTGTYEDGEGEGKAVEATSAYAVRAFPSGNSAPGFAEDFDTQKDGDDPPSAKIDDGATEGTAAGAPIEASDANNDLLTYSLTAETTGTPANADVFQIDRESGQVTVGLGKTVHPTSDSGLTASDAIVLGDSFTFIITATDPSGLTDTVTMTVTVEAEDEAPVFTEDGGQAAHTFKEIPEGTDSPVLEVDTFVATDVEGHTLSYAMSGADMSKFTLTAGTLSFAAAPDFEMPGSVDGDNVYEITITAASGTDLAQKRTPLAVTVTVTNEDDPGTISLSATQPRYGTVLTATDPSDTDGGVSGVTWKWERDGTGTVASPSSDCTAIAADGWEDAKGAGATSASYTPAAGDVGKCLRATASYTDAHGPDKTAPVVSDQAVASARNLAPVFTDEDTETDGTQLNTRDVPENSSAGTSVGAVIPATDTADDESADNNALVFSLSGTGAGLFNIASPGGQITVTAANTLDYEIQKTYTVTVTVRDLEGLNSSIDLTIKVTDVNEAPTVMRADSITPNRAPTFPSQLTSLSIPENTPAGIGIGSPLDADDLDGDILTYTLEGTDAASFDIDAGTGQLLTKAPLDREAKSTYMVVVKATDPDGLSATITVDITVTDVDENQDPAFPFPRDDRSVAENTVAGENIGDPVAAIDGDGDTLTYTLGGADMADFDIDPATGQLMTKSPLDYETKSTYTVTVTASDNSGGQDEVTVTITVTDVDETAQTLLQRYDTDGDGCIQLDEARTAVGDYFGPPKGSKLSLEDAREVVGLHFECRNMQS